MKLKKPKKSESLRAEMKSFKAPPLIFFVYNFCSDENFRLQGLAGENF